MPTYEDPYTGRTCYYDEPRRSYAEHAEAGSSKNGGSRTYPDDPTLGKEKSSRTKEWTKDQDRDKKRKEKKDGHKKKVKKELAKFEEKFNKQR